MKRMPSLEADELREHSGALQALANDCRDDPELRAKVDADPRAAFADRDVRLSGPRGACAGRARGVDDAGRLGVAAADGLRWFDAADVRLEAL